MGHHYTEVGLKPAFRLIPQGGAQQYGSAESHRHTDTWRALLQRKYRIPCFSKEVAFSAPCLPSDPLSLKRKKPPISPLQSISGQSRTGITFKTWRTSLILSSSFLWRMAQGKLLGKSMEQAETWSFTFSIWISSILLYHRELLFLSCFQTFADRLSVMHKEFLAFIHPACPQNPQWVQEKKVPQTNTE